MKKDESSDNIIAYSALFAAIFFTGFLLSWAYVKAPTKPAMTFAFAQVGTISFQVQDHTVRTTLAIESTNTDDVRWIGENKLSLQKFLQVTLETSAPEKITTPNGAKFSQLQNLLTEAMRSRFPNRNIQQVVITDYLTSTD